MSILIFYVWFLEKYQGFSQFLIRPLAIKVVSDKTYLCILEIDPLIRILIWK